MFLVLVVTCFDHNAFPRQLGQRPRPMSFRSAKASGVPASNPRNPLMQWQVHYPDAPSDCQSYAYQLGWCQRGLSGAAVLCESHELRLGYGSLTPGFNHPWPVRGVSLDVSGLPKNHECAGRENARLGPASHQPRSRLRESYLPTLAWQEPPMVFI